MCIKTIAKVTRKELEPFILEKFDPDWGGSCLISSWILNKSCKYKGYDTKLAVGYYGFSEHAFILFKDKVIDITATQFNLDEIHIEKFEGSRYSIDYIGKDVYSVIDIWPREQVYTTYQHRLRNIYEKIRRQI